MKRSRFNYLLTKHIRITFILSIFIFSLYSAESRKFPVPPEFKNINLDTYLKNNPAVKLQIKCVVYDGPCDSIGKYLKKSLPDVLNNQCPECNSEQKKQVGQIAAFIQQNYAKEWDDAVKKYQKTI